jgi:MoxR-like ATPase
MRRIIRVHFPDLDSELMETAISAFYRMRKVEAVEKKPATRELINWIRALKADPDFKPKQLAKGDLPYLGVLFKKSQDYARAQSALNGRRLN